ncbi:MAG: pyruvate formate lyase family protein [Candidatus Latescibacteria bacterium]|jgi:formate C-acetyltransferase|nr:pyruvate formate lyase family protein [Candidatus Latescibacterota bacterium]
MDTLANVVATPQLWGTFERVRDHLMDQFRDVPYVPGTGLAPEDLQQLVGTYLKKHGDHPKVLQKANVYRIVVTNGQIHLDPEDWFADKLDHGGHVKRLRDSWHHEAKEGSVRQESSWFGRLSQLGVLRGGFDMGHISPGWENMFSEGLTGLVEKARQGRQGTPEGDPRAAFYEAVEVVCGATIALSERFADLAEALVHDHPEDEERLRAVAKVCRRVPAHSPRTFHEALQFAWLMHEMIEMEGEAVRSMGHFDRTMYPYYRADIDSGRLTREQAKELIKFHWFRYHAHTRGVHNGKNFVFGGQYADGSVLCNDLTYAALEAYEELNVPDPKLSVRFVPDSPDRLYKRVADLIRQGHNSFVLMNDVPAVDGQVRRGKARRDARTYLPIGCYEPAVDGKEAGCTMNLVINLAKGVEFALHDGTDPLSGERVGPRTGDPRGFDSFEALFEGYARQIEFLVSRSVEYVGAHEEAWPEINPSPLIAATIDDCLALGKDIGEGGAHYNAVGCVGVALANVCDSLLAVKQAVYEKKRYTMDEVLKAIDCDFEGHESMRQYLLNRVPKWGNNNPEADDLARRVADHYCDYVHTFTNARGGPVQAALFTLTFQWTMGQTTGALPDGRRAHDTLAPGVGAMSGRDLNGVTALMRSVAKIDFTETPNGSVLDVMLHPTSVRGEAGLDAMAALIKTFFAEGGYAVQFNVCDAETLRDAQLHPERHASLQIRVTGWSVFFNTLSKYEQDQFIARTFHEI